MPSLPPASWSRSDTMIHRRSKQFKKLFDALPRDVQELAKRNFVLLKATPSHPSLDFKRLADNLRNVWSVRVGGSWRALGRQTGDTLDWFWIGPHEAYNSLVGTGPGRKSISEVKMSLTKAEQDEHMRQLVKYVLRFSAELSMYGDELPRLEQLLGFKALPGEKLGAFIKRATYQVPEAETALSNTFIFSAIQRIISQNTAIDAIIDRILDGKRKVEAIKLVRDNWGLRLRDAKDVADHLQHLLFTRGFTNNPYLDKLPLQSDGQHMFDEIVRKSKLLNS